MKKLLRGKKEGQPNQVGAVLFLLTFIELHQQMLQSDGVEEYFGYNSILTTEGKRLRRLRRTEVSTEKLLYMRVTSPQDPLRSNNKTKTLRENKSSQAQTPLAHSRSKLVVRYSSNLLNGFYRQKHEFRSEYQSTQNVNQQHTSFKTSIARTMREEGNVPNKMGEYYFDSQAFEDKNKKTKKRSLSRKESYGPKVQSCKQLVYNKKEHSDYQVQYPNIPRQKMKKMGKILLKADAKEAMGVKVDYNSSPNSKISLNEKLKQQKGSKLKSQKNNSKISQCSIDHQQNFIKGEKSKEGSKVIHFPSQISSHQSQKHIPSSPPSQVKEKSSIIKSIVSAKQLTSGVEESKVSRVSQKSIADKIRSKLKEKMQQSKLSSSLSQSSSKMSKRSKNYQMNTESDNFKVIDKSERMVLTKKSTEADECSQTGEGFHTPKMNKKLSFGLSEAKLKTETRQNTKGDQQINKFVPLPNTKSNPEAFELEKKKGQQLSYQEIVKNIEEHDIRLGYIYLFVDNIHNSYQTTITFEKYQRLCFLMLKKYVFEKNRLITTLEGGKCCLILTGSQVPQTRLQQFLNTPQIQQKLSVLREQVQELTTQIQQQFSSLQKKFKKDKLMKLSHLQDVFSKEIVSLLVAELTKLYTELEVEGDDFSLLETQKSQQRIIQIIEIMFLMSELSGRPVKKFEMYQQNEVDFNAYYAQNYEKWMDTTDYFQKKEF